VHYDVNGVLARHFEVQDSITIRRRRSERAWTPLRSAVPVGDVIALLPIYGSSFLIDRPALLPWELCLFCLFAPLGRY